VGAREEILDAISAIRVRTGDDTFTPQDVINELADRSSDYSPTTIRTHISSRMCSDSPNHHGTVYDDLERIDRGRYRLRNGPA
jgi:hypothetical protein